MTVTTSLIAKRLEPGLAALFGKSYDSFGSQYKEIYETRKSDKAKEEMVMTVGLGLAPVKPEGGLIHLDNFQDGYTARTTHVNVAMGYVMTQEAIDDNLYESQSEMRTKALGRSLAETKELRAAMPLNNAFSGSGVLIGDGKTLCATDHPLAGGGTMSNSAGGVDMSETALKNAIIAIRTGFVDDRGIKIRVSPKKLIVSPTDSWAAMEALKSDMSTITATQGATGITNTNNMNSLRAGGFFPEGVMVYDYLTDQDAWFILTDVDNGLIHWERKAREFAPLHTDPHTGNVMVTAQERYSFMVGDFRRVYGSSGA